MLGPTLEREATYLFVDDKLASIDFRFNRGQSLQGYLKALTEKYGEPKEIAQSTSHNGFGAEYKGNCWRWESGSSEIILDEYGDNIYVGHLSFQDKVLTALFSSRNSPAEPI